ncbi:BMP family ABC transporter substrate-binding protein [Cnuibacter physcomitrellae]|uniref:putative B6 ABC transporter substrate-binding protein n=1 Tax=Cnuibacter physcomitrellae TaxID=1619308 RepID=UPI002175A6C0|nr:BMP family ABC transporter substrate-binding protein [Cnuibacter physcomitrellae]MCS5497083.1 BMP family ABC transporter substrate-binding protein [Cnuibacter physcomitrellae]
MFTFTGGSSSRTVSRVAALTAAGALAIGLAACSGGRGDDSGAGSTSSAGTEVTKFALVAPENESDFGWNQAGLMGADQAATDLGIEVTLVPDAGWDNAETVLGQVADGGAQFIIAHASGYGVAATSVAQDKNVPILIQDAGDNIPGKIAVTKTEAQEGGYLAGIAAAMTTKSKTIGIVVSADDLNWFKMAAGFAEGVYSVDPSINVLYTSVGPAAYADAAGGKTATEQLIASGADVIFGMGDGATHGYLQAVEAAPGVKYIADIGDVTSGLSDPSVLLTSVLWNYGPTYEQAIADVEAGTFGQQGYDLTVDNGGLSLQETENLTSQIQSAIDTAKKGIADGSITPTAASTADEVTAVIAKKGA